MNNKELARKDSMFSFLHMTTSTIWASFENYFGRKYIVVSVFDNKKIFNVDYFCCENLMDLNNVKSTLQNAGFKIRWNKFNEALEYLK